MRMFDVITEVCVVREFNNDGCTWRTFDVITEGYIVSSFILIMVYSAYVWCYYWRVYSE